jgi:hypothetical protein
MSVVVCSNEVPGSNPFFRASLDVSIWLGSGFCVVFLGKFS